jgi:hypothetical protein
MVEDFIGKILGRKNGFDGRVFVLEAVRQAVNNALMGQSQLMGQSAAKSFCTAQTA